MQAALRSGELPVLFTSRQLETRPRFVVVMGSTTSHALASSSDRPARFPDLLYVVLAGGVDGAYALAAVGRPA